MKNFESGTISIRRDPRKKKILLKVQRDGDDEEKGRVRDNIEKSLVVFHARGGNEARRPLAIIRKARVSADALLVKPGDSPVI